MEVQSDFRDLLRLFNENKVEYIIVGAYALAFHGAPRYTGDLDIFVKPDIKNAKNILSALSEFGFGSVGLNTSDFVLEDQVIQLGLPPVRIDIITSLTELTWEEVIAGRQKGMYGDIPVHFIGRKEYIKNKRVVGRKKDLADLEMLGEE